MPQRDSSSFPHINKTGIRAIVGLGNEGERYANNRHNAGVWFLELIAQAYHASLTPNNRLAGRVCQIRVDGTSVRLFKPNGFMNNSGHPVKLFMSYFSLNPDELLVAHDEIDFPLARVRIKRGGGHGGHNGLRHIIQLLGRQFWRLRIGIGRPPHQDIEPADYVLADATPSQRARIAEALEKVAQYAPQLALGEYSTLMNDLAS